MKNFFELKQEVEEMKSKLRILEDKLSTEETNLRQKVKCSNTTDGDKILSYNGKSWLAKKSEKDWSISVYPVTNAGKTGKKRVAHLTYGGIAHVRLQIALGIIQ